MKEEREKKREKRRKEGRGSRGGQSRGKEGEGKKCMVQLPTGHVILLTAQLVLRKTSTQHL